jgi:hypothetical protein
MKYTLLLVTMVSITPGVNVAFAAPEQKEKTITMDIATDLPPSAAANEVMPTHPFFSESTANELMEKIQDLEERVQKLEKAVGKK